MFHSWGFLHFSLGLALGSTYVLRRRFKPEGALEAVAEHEADALVVVPVMLQRIMELARGDPRRATTSPRCASPPSAARRCPGELAIRWMDGFGDNLYNLYGSTEVAWASIATPEDMRDAPGTAGRAPHGTVVKIFDEDGKEVPARRDRAGSSSATRWPSRATPAAAARTSSTACSSSGDVGHFDEDGRLFIDGRDDEMIVSGGENVFPREVEDLLSDHDAIDEAAVIGVDDEKFGQRLKAFVVTGSGKDLDEDDVKAHVKENLARYKVPRDVEFLDELPRNPTGKVLKKRARVGASPRSAAMREITIKDTLSGELRTLEAGPGGEVGIYACGPTTYGPIHIGNARPYVVFCCSAGSCAHEGYAPTLVINLTDVNDKIYDAAARAGRPLRRARRGDDRRPTSPTPTRSGSAAPTTSRRRPRRSARSSP